jgi:hypothetical protein
VLPARNSTKLELLFTWESCHRSTEQSNLSSKESAEHHGGKNGNWLDYVDEKTNHKSDEHAEISEPLLCNVQLGGTC